MNSPVSLRQGHRIGSALLLVLALVALLTGVSWRQARHWQDDTQVVPAAPSQANLLHSLMRMADEARGLEALHLAPVTGQDRGPLTAQLQFQRKRFQHALGLAQRQQPGADELAHLQQVQQAADDWWRLQDQVLGPAPLAGGGPAPAATSRQLLAGESQRAYHRLLQALQDWWLWREAQQAAAHQAAAGLPWLLAACTGLLLLASALAAVLWRQQRRLRRMLAGPLDGDLANLPRHQLLSQALLWRLGQTGQPGAASPLGDAAAAAAAEAAVKPPTDAPTPRPGQPPPDGPSRPA